jgi:YegS/Rv2252/BmrU family lipid kinase
MKHGQPSTTATQGAAVNTRRTRALLIVNPKSRQGAEAGLDDGLQRLALAGMEVEYLLSHSPEESHAAVDARKADLDLVIVGGGDGTLSSMIKVLLACDLPLAILPLGTANDLARSLNIPEELELAFEVIAVNHRARIDLGEVNDHYFFNVANMGLGVHVTEELTDAVKKRWGVFSYVRALAGAIMRHDQFRLRVTLDGKKYRLRSMHLAVGNGRFYGGGNVVNENSRIDDGKLSLYSLRPVSVWEFITLAPLLRNGQQSRDRRVFCAQAREINIRAGKRQLEIHADGEPVSHTPAAFRVHPLALEVVAPAIDAHLEIKEDAKSEPAFATAIQDQGVNV